MTLDSTQPTDCICLTAWKFSSTQHLQTHALRANHVRCDTASSDSCGILTQMLNRNANHGFEHDSSKQMSCLTLTGSSHVFHMEMLTRLCPRRLPAPRGACAAPFQHAARMGPCSWILRCSASRNPVDNKSLNTLRVGRTSCVSMHAASLQNIGQQTKNAAR